MKSLGARLIGIGLVLALSVVGLGGVRPLAGGNKAAGPYASAGGGGVQPDPPGNAVLGLYNAVPTHVTVSSRTQSGPWVVQVRLPSGGGVVDSGLTDGSGHVMLEVIDVHGLGLDVLDTDAIDVPVQAGASVYVIVQ